MGGCFGEVEFALSEGHGVEAAEASCEVVDLVEGQFFFAGGVKEFRLEEVNGGGNEFVLGRKLGGNLVGGPMRGGKVFGAFFVAAAVAETDDRSFGSGDAESFWGRRRNQLGEFFEGIATLDQVHDFVLIFGEDVVERAVVSALDGNRGEVKSRKRSGVDRIWTGVDRHGTGVVQGGVRRLDRHGNGLGFNGLRWFRIEGGIKILVLKVLNLFGREVENFGPVNWAKEFKKAGAVSFGDFDVLDVAGGEFGQR